ncbi:MAG: imidazole glycerol phosphate synthase subunit HisH [Clostridia bacterium]|nr:imidazole glycerol phosphate synthase subunit HisH [Clostridia bacterium]
MTAVIDYNAGNIQSVKNALESLGESVVITADADTILSADRVILPGVGAFGFAMDKLKAGGLDKVIRQVVEKGIPFLGICLGLQLLFEESEESPGVFGLGLLKGKILKIPEGENIKIPHIGWNSLEKTKDCPLFYGIESGDYVYFVHSYYLKATDQSDVSANTEYSTTLNVAVSRGNVFATQFHPEKSGKTGLKILKNFIDYKG